jgi:hypothetical protein
MPPREEIVSRTRSRSSEGMASLTVTLRTCRTTSNLFSARKLAMSDLYVFAVSLFFSPLARTRSCWMGSGESSETMICWTRSELLSSSAKPLDKDGGRDPG